MSESPDFLGWAKSRPWYKLALYLLEAGASCVSVRDETFPEWPNSVVLSGGGHAGQIVVFRRREGWEMKVRSAWEGDHA